MISYLPLTWALNTASSLRRRLPILIYHRVLARADPLQPDIPDSAVFRWQMALLARHFRPLPLQDAVQRLKQGTLPARAVCVTFDDGYADNLLQALPILQHYQIPATFFIATAFLHGEQMFNDSIIEWVRALPDGQYHVSDISDNPIVIADIASRRAAIHTLLRQCKYQIPIQRQALLARLYQQHSPPAPAPLMLTPAQLRTLDHTPGMSIGAHTHRHPILRLLPAPEAKQEIEMSKQQLEQLLGKPITLFAYPNGRPNQDYDETHVDIVKQCGFSLACSTTPCAADSDSDTLELPRFLPWDRSPSRFALRLLKALIHHP